MNSSASAQIKQLRDMTQTLQNDRDQLLAARRAYQPLIDNPLIGPQIQPVVDSIDRQLASKENALKTIRSQLDDLERAVANGWTPDPNDQEMPLDALMMLIQVERVDLLDQSMRSHMKSVQDKNERLKVLNNQLIVINAELAALDPEKDKDAHNKKTKDAEKIKGEISSITSESQVDMINLQQAIYKHNNALELLSNFVSKWHQALSKLVGNIR